MGKSNAERQAAYRARYFVGVDGGLERLASCYAVTQREVIESLLAQAEGRLLESLTANEQGQYFDQSAPLRGNGRDVTQ